MKRLLCVLLCMLLAVPCAGAETADTLQKLLVRQLTAGYGLRGNITITANGVADWLEYLLPFTVPDIQIRAIGQKQGGASDAVDDDDEWQVRLYAKNSEGKEVGTTWLYGDPEGIYFQSELLPDTILALPVADTHLLYQLFRGDLTDLFFSFDPMELSAPGPNGNPSSYEALANILGIPAETWETEWFPVLKKYFQHLDLWLTGYGDPSFMTGDTGALKLSATYTIPVDDLKAEAKYLVGQMLYDGELQNLLAPLVAMEERVIYLNPSLVYFYEACIDALPLEGDIILSREMSAQGEIVSTMVSLPLPTLPEEMIAPVGNAAASIFGLPYTDLLQGMKRVAITQNGTDRTLTLSGEKRSLSFGAVVSNPDEDTTVLQGAMRIAPNAGVEENALSATFTCSMSHKIWQDEKYIDHDTTAFSIAFVSDLDELSPDDPFRSTYIDFSPVSLAYTLDYRNNSFQEESPAQVNLSVDAQLPDAQVSVDAVARITTQLSMQKLSSMGAQDMSTLSEERKDEIVSTLLSNAVITMANLNTDAAPAEPSVSSTTE